MYRVTTTQGGFILGEFEEQQQAEMLVKEYTKLDESMGIFEKDYYKVVGV